MSALPTAVTLPARGWTRGNRAALRQWLARPRPDGSAAAAVFDFDNTIIAGDIGDAVLRAQLDGLWLRQSPATFAAQLPPALGPAEALAEDVMAAYHALWTEGMGQGGVGLGGAAHLDLRAKLGHLYVAMKAAPGVGTRVAYAWVAGLVGGLDAEEAAVLTGRAWRAGAAMPPAVATWEPATAGRSGREPVRFRRGLALQPEMVDLMAALAAAGIAVHIVSATHQQVVRALAQVLALPVAADRIIGMRPDDPGHPVTYREGKVVAVQALVHGEPLLVAGDANTDYEMLTHFEATQVRLIVNRNAPPPLADLYPDARTRGRAGRPLTLLQGRDDTTGRFWPRRETRPLGAAAPRPLPARPRRR